MASTSHRAPAWSRPVPSTDDAACAQTNPFRPLFPALAATDAVFLDNAGGSQLPGVVADAMHRYMLNSFVQTGADYPASQAATATVRRAHDYLKVFVGAASPDGDPPVGEVIIGPSTSQLCRMLADCYAQVLSPGDEVIVCETAHESNVGPWMSLARSGIIVKRWVIDAHSANHDGSDPIKGAGGSQRLEQLAQLLSPRTKLVAFPHVSNILGEIVDVSAITALAHSVGAQVVVDGVAFAPHRPINVAAWNVDWYVYSTYKVFGPHAAALFGTHAAMSKLTGPNHYFIPREEVPRKFELGGANHESCAGIVALEAYVQQATQAWGGVPHPPHARAVIERAFQAFELLENELQEHFMRWLAAQPAFRIIGPSHHAPTRVCTISFVSTQGLSSKAIAQHCNALGLGIRYGNFYAYRLCESLGLPPSDGVVRVSFAHYNTHAEVDRLIAALSQLL